MKVILPKSMSAIATTNIEQPTSMFVLAASAPELQSAVAAMPTPTSSKSRKPPQAPR